MFGEMNFVSYLRDISNHYQKSKHKLNWPAYSSSLPNIKHMFAALIWFQSLFNDLFFDIPTVWFFRNSWYKQNNSILSYQKQFDIGIIFKIDVSWSE